MFNAPSLAGINVHSKLLLRNPNACQIIVAYQHTGVWLTNAFGSMNTFIPILVAIVG